MRQRLVWIDIAKGVGIIFVVVGHAGRGILNAGVADEGGLLPVIDSAIYAFHMPFFFLLTGITFGLSPPVNIQYDLLRKLWRLFYTLVIWTYAFLAMRALAGSSANVDGSWFDLLVFPLPPFAHFWFLWALLINTAIWTALRLISLPYMSEIHFWIAAVTISIIVKFAVVLPDQMIPILGSAINYSFAFTIGALIICSPARIIVPSRNAAFSGIVIFVVGILAIIFFQPNTYNVTIGTFLALSLIAPIILISKNYGDTIWGRILAFIGTVSMAIYVMHTMFSASFRILLLELGVDDLVVHLALGIMAGVFGPLIIYLFVRRLGALRITGLA